ncbi:hypothetical protein FJY93_04605 [Candidatus Kaiserbacteria bacterium]|nr:hypothetical protein [Candidatus Kaiserbacteria bacterium]
MTERVFIVDYAYGFHADTCEVDYVCRLRSLSTIRAFKCYPHARIVLAAGLTERTGDCGPLASWYRANSVCDEAQTADDA